MNATGSIGSDVLLEYNEAHAEPIPTTMAQAIGWWRAFSAPSGRDPLPIVLVFLDCQQFACIILRLIRRDCI